MPIRPEGFDFQPTLTGALVELRPLRAGDVDALYAGASDPLLSEQHRVKDRQREQVFRPYFELLLEARSRSAGRFSSVPGRFSDL